MGKTLRFSRHFTSGRRRTAFALVAALLSSLVLLFSSNASNPSLNRVPTKATNRPSRKVMASPTPRPIPPHVDMPQSLAASYYSLNNDLRATLMLSNQGPHSMNILVSLFNLKVDRLVVPPILLDGNTVRGFHIIYLPT